MLGHCSCNFQSWSLEILYSEMHVLFSAEFADVDGVSEEAAAALQLGKAWISVQGLQEVPETE